MTMVLYIDGGGPVEVEFVELTAFVSIGASSFDVPANWGDPASGKKVVVAVHWVSVGGGTLVSTAIGGETAAILEQEISGGGDTPLGVALIMAANVPGSSGNISLVFSASAAARCGVWSALDVEDMTPVDTDDDWWGFDSASHGVTLDVEDRGALFAAVTAQADAPDFTAGVTVEDYSQEINTSSPIKVAGGFALISATALNQAVTVVRGGPDTWRGSVVAASIR